MCPNRAGGSPILGKDSAAAAVGTFAVSTAGDKKGRHLRFARRLLNLFPALCADLMSATLFEHPFPLVV